MSDEEALFAGLRGARPPRGLHERALESGAAGLDVGGGTRSTAASEAWWVAATAVLLALHVALSVGQGLRDAMPARNSFRSSLGAPRAELEDALGDLSLLFDGEMVAGDSYLGDLP